MTTNKLNKYWTLGIILLVAIIATGSVIIWSRYRGNQPIEISIPPSQELQGEVYIGGAVNSPGFYSLKAEDTIKDIIQAAGGTSNVADLSRLKLYIPEIEEQHQPQKIDLNRAEAWLLEALPGIGETLAQRIVDYRNQNGLFRKIYELTNVEGIGPATYEKIKDLVTVAD